MAKARRRIKARFYVLLLVLIGSVAGIVALIASAGGSNELEYGSLGFQKDINVAIVRDETLISAESYSKLSFFVNEGERVDKGKKIVEVYIWGFTEGALQELLALQQRIKDYQQETIKDITSNKELNDLNSEVMNASAQAREVVRKRGKADLVEVERSLREAMEQRRIYLKDTVKSDPTLNEMYKEEEPKIAQIENFKRDYVAEQSGMVSFYFDGYEKTFSADERQNISIDTLTKLFRGTLAKPVESRSERPLYRMVDTTKWYCLFGTPKNDSLSISENVTVSIAFEGYYDKPYQGKVASVKRGEDGSTVYVLEMQDDLGPFLAVRKAKATLKRDFQGFKVPVGMLKTQDAQMGLRVRDGNNVSFIPVNVLFQNNNEAIVEAADESKPLLAQMKLVS